MLMPKKVKHRKTHRGRTRGQAKGGTQVSFGEYGIQALEPGWITARQIEAARIAMTRHIKRGGKVWIYKGEILPYKAAFDDKINREAAMAVGETSGGPAKPVVSSAARRRAGDAEDAPAEGAATEEGDEGREAEPLIKEADPELERLLAEEEEIERQTKERHETPHFRDQD